ncbi:MAG: cation diffusion facilitator family transporter [Ignavibacteriales bacterium]|nr:cation diffusion facilitator family transporter [Ignavibacteriales bacterium]
MEQHKIDEKKRVALISVFGALLITGMKLIVGIQTNSLGILSEAAHSGLDLIAAVITYFAVRIADKPADEKHQYGHGKIENVSAFVETLLLVLTCSWIIYEAIRRLITGTTEVEVNIWGFGVVLFAIIVDISRARALSKVAKKYNSQALEADALHFSSDVWSSLVVIAGLFFVSVGYVWMDALAAIMVAILVLFVSYRLGRRTVDALMDRVPDGVTDEITSIIKNVSGVEKIQNTRLRTSGGKLFIDATVAIRRTTPFMLAHGIMDRIEKAIHEKHGDADVVVHAEPFESGDETISDKVRMIVVGRGMRVPHNLEVHHNNGRYQVDFDIEHQKGKTFVEAHELTSEIEKEIIQKLPAIDKVTIHMEEFDTDHNEIIVESAAHLEDKVRSLVSAEKRILKCSDVNIIKIGEKYNLSLTCQFDKTKTLDEVHLIISELETILYTKLKEFRRITIHAEPL